MLNRFLWRMLGWRGWTFSGVVPPVSRAVLIVAPHTSNWDMPILLLYRYALGIRVNYLAKHSLFWWPLGPLLRATGAIPVDRRHGHDTIEQIKTRFAIAQRMFLALAPEGTRSWRPHWKSGFYRISRAARVPIVLVSMDYANRRVTMSAPVELTGSIAADMSVIRQFYAGVTARYPTKFGPVRLAEESATDQAIVNP